MSFLGVFVPLLFKESCRKPNKNQIVLVKFISILHDQTLPLISGKSRLVKYSNLAKFHLRRPYGSPICGEKSFPGDFGLLHLRGLRKVMAITHDWQLDVGQGVSNLWYLLSQKEWGT